MAYTKTNWVNGTTPINATNLNHIEDGIEAVDTTTTMLTYNLVTGANPIKTGIKVNGKDEYIYQQYVSALPSTTTPVTHETPIALSDIELVTDIGGSCYRSSSDTWYIANAPRVDTIYNICVNGGSSNSKFAFSLEVGSDRSNVEGWFYVKYTKAN